MKLHLKESPGPEKVTGRTWKEFIANIERNTRFTVDSADKVRYGQWVTIYDENHKWQEVEVTRYSDGTYELLLNQTETKV